MRACSVRELHHLHSTPTNSSQSDTLQVKSQILVKNIIWWYNLGKLYN